MENDSNHEKEIWLELEQIAKKIETPCMSQIKSDIGDAGVVLFGAGIYGEIAAGYLKHNGARVLCYCDNDKNKQGEIIDGIPVIPSEELLKLGSPVILITARHNVGQISQQLDRLGLAHTSFDTFLVKNMLDKYRYVFFDLLYDKRSKQTLVQVLKSMLYGSNTYCSSVMEENAFWAIPEFVNTGREIFVDAGAYVGDTVEQFIWKNIGEFQKIYAFEPGERQYAAMCRRVSRLEEEWAVEREKIVCIKGALGEADAVGQYTYNDASPLGSNFVTNNHTNTRPVQIYSLDKFLGKEKVTLIKADIEGFELEMLKGAAESIRHFRPKLAISVYHKPEDLFEIPIFIKSLVPEYKMAVRHHAPTLVDTVLYCWI